MYTCNKQEVKKGAHHALRSRGYLKSQSGSPNISNLYRWGGSDRDRFNPGTSDSDLHRSAVVVEKRVVGGLWEAAILRTERIVHFGADAHEPQAKNTIQYSLKGVGEREIDEPIIWTQRPGRVIGIWNILIVASIAPPPANCEHDPGGHRERTQRKHNCSMCALVDGWVGRCICGEGLSGCKIGVSGQMDRLVRVRISR